MEKYFHIIISVAVVSVSQCHSVIVLQCQYSVSQYCSVVTLESLLLATKVLMTSECTMSPMSTKGSKRGKSLFQTCTKTCPISKTHLPIVYFFTSQNAQKCDNTADIIFMFTIFHPQGLICPHTLITVETNIIFLTCRNFTKSLEFLFYFWFVVCREQQFYQCTY